MKSYSTNSKIVIRDAINNSNGNEVFFLGHTDQNLNIWSVTVLARGNQHSVPAITKHCHPGDTVIHNHPSGNLTPSTADLQIAASLGEQGIGFHIVDNAVENVYKVVETLPKTRQSILKPQEIADILAPTGPLAAHLDNYEERPEQLQMAFAVSDAFNQDGLATIEAGTGTGKSLAYLIPASLWALRNEEPVVVSTNTINLQEQLLHHDLPLLKKILPDDFQAVLVKGRNNYVCLRRLETAHREPDLFNPKNSNELNELVTWATTSKSGSRDELNIVPTNNVWSEIRCEIDQCPRNRCHHYARCFFHKARRRATHADLLIVNHSLLLSDLAVRLQTENYSAAAVLPPYSRIIIDEAHHLEDTATRNFTIRISHFSFSKILNRLCHPRKQERGQLARLLNSVAKQLPDSATKLYESIYTQIDTLTTQCHTLRNLTQQQFQQHCAALNNTNQSSSSYNNSSWRITASEAQTPRWNTLHNDLHPLVQTTIDLAKKLENLRKDCEQSLVDTIIEKIAPQLNDIQGLSDRLGALGSDLNYFLTLDDQACSWTEISTFSNRRQSEATLWLNSAPIDVASTLKKAVYDRFRTVIMTSATLSTNNSFKFFTQRTGLNLCAPTRCHELQLDSPFDFAKQAVIALPTDIVPPNHAEYASMLLEQIELATRSASGRTFVLFTAYSLLRKLYTQLDAPFNAQGFRCLRQGQAARHQLLEQFKHGDGNVLFGTDSFWEGVDVPGKALEQVIITRLPFRVPTEPIQIARCEAIEDRGGNPFTQYSVPQAIIRLKQGFGRLIRHRNDRGVILILDQRINNKTYGRMFLNSLPAARRIAAPAQQVQQEINNFFAQPPAERTNQD